MKDGLKCLSYLLIVLSFLGVSILGYSLAARVNQWTAQRDLHAILFPKEGSPLPVEAEERIAGQFATLDTIQGRDWRILHALSAANVVMSIVILVLLRRCRGTCGHRQQ